MKKFFKSIGPSAIRIGRMLFRFNQYYVRAQVYKIEPTKDGTYLFVQPIAFVERPWGKRAVWVQTKRLASPISEDSLSKSAFAKYNTNVELMRRVWQSRIMNDKEFFSYVNKLNSTIRFKERINVQNSVQPNT